MAGDGTFQAFISWIVQHADKNELAQLAFIARMDVSESMIGRESAALPPVERALIDFANVAAIERGVSRAPAEAFPAVDYIEAARRGVLSANRVFVGADLSAHESGRRLDVRFSGLGVGGDFSIFGIDKLSEQDAAIVCQMFATGKVRFESDLSYKGARGRWYVRNGLS